jgi:hypothetical protein
MKKNTAGQVIGCQMVNAADGSAFTGTVTVYITGDGGGQVIGSVGGGVCSHEGNGLHTYTPSQAETNFTLVEFTFVGTGAVPQTLHAYTGFPQSGDTFPLAGTIDAKTTNLPADPASQAAVAALINALNNLSAAQVLAQVNAALQATVSDSIPADGTRPSIMQGIYMLTQFLCERTVSGTQVIVKKPDGTTTLFTLGLNDAEQPTRITRSA